VSTLWGSGLSVEGGSSAVPVDYKCPVCRDRDSLPHGGAGRLDHVARDARVHETPLLMRLVDSECQVLESLSQFRAVDRGDRYLVPELPIIDSRDRAVCQSVPVSA